ncbi:MAG: gamma-glutamyltransferase family protein [Pseudomonadota bacterium]
MRDFHHPGRSAVFAANGMCATSHPLAAKAAIDMLERGGNAADAAVAAAVILGLAEPQMAGLGGDCFALVSPPGTEDILALNGTGHAPHGLGSEILRRDGHDIMPSNSAHAVTVPGAVAGFCALSERFGSLGLAAALAPAIRYADEGIPVAPRVARDWRAGAEKLGEGGRSHYLNRGAPFEVGQIFRAPGQAEVLRRIADQGPAGFYEGETAADMVTSLRAMGGAHTLDDFAQTEAVWGTAISGPYRGVDLIEHPPNGAGAAVLLMAGILENFDLGVLDPLGPERAHLEAEAMKLAVDARNRFVADANHVTRLDHMTDPSTAAALARLIDRKHAMPAPAELSEAVHRETVYLSVVDRDRMVVSLIYSIFHDFGSGLASSKYGILFHNRGAGFSLAPGHPNEVGPGKRPAHTILPAMTKENGVITSSFGVMGGAYQPNGQLRVLTNIQDFGMDPQTAIDAPRTFPDAGKLKVERGYPETVRRALEDLGHAVDIPDAPIGGAQMVRIDPKSGVLEGASDPRKDGCALGY